MADALIALGSNLGERAELLSKAAARLREHPQVKDLKLSSLLETQPVGGPGAQGVFLNACARLQTSLSASDVLELLLETEQQLGRTRQERWEARHIDLDLLLYDDTILRSPPLEIPHPRMAVRRFVLQPAAEIAADMMHPVFGWTIEELWQHLLHAPPLFCVQAETQTAADTLVHKAEQMLADKLGQRVFVCDCDNNSGSSDVSTGLEAGKTVLTSRFENTFLTPKLLAKLVTSTKDLPRAVAKVPCPFIQLPAHPSLENRAAVELAAAIEAMR